MSVPALVSGARALARIPVLFSICFRHRTIFLTVTAIVSPSLPCPKNRFTVSGGKILLRTDYGCKLNIEPTLPEDFIRKVAEIAALQLTLKVIPTNQRSFFLLAGIIFTIIALWHLLGSSTTVISL